MTFGFSFAYLLLSVISWEKVDLMESRASSSHYYLGSQRLHARESETHDVHNDLDDSSIRGPDYVFQAQDEDQHRGMVYLTRSLNFCRLSFLTSFHYILESYFLFPSLSSSMLYFLFNFDAVKTFLDRLVCNDSLELLAFQGIS